MSPVLLPRVCRNRPGLGFSAFARHYLRNHCYVLFLWVMRCFSSPRSLTAWQCVVLDTTGCPIRTSTDQWIFAPPRSFSQLIASFFAFESLGILHAPFFTFSAVRHVAVPGGVMYTWFALLFVSRFLFFSFFQYVKDLFSWRITDSNR